MGIVKKKIHTYNITFACDYCRVTVERPETRDTSPPPGWAEVVTHGWGSTGYSKETLLCPTCLESEKRTQ